MVRIKVINILLLFLFSLTTSANENLIESAESAAFPALASKATIKDWNGNVLRKGTNGWTCLPDKDTPGNDPWCVNDPWMNFLSALKNKTKPSYTKVGIAYMLQGDTPVSNSNPYASEATSNNDWVTDLGAHLMVLIPDIKSYENYPTNWRHGGPWIMWKDTPYVHLMIPLGNANK